MASVAGSLTPLREPAAIFLCRFLLSLEGRPPLRATLRSSIEVRLLQQVPELLQFPRQPDHR